MRLLQAWVYAAIKTGKMKIGFKSESGTSKELQDMLSSNKKEASKPNDDNLDTCHISHSPYRILRVSKT